MVDIERTESQLLRCVGMYEKRRIVKEVNDWGVCYPTGEVTYECHYTLMPTTVYIKQEINYLHEHAYNLSYPVAVKSCCIFCKTLALKGILCVHVTTSVVENV